MRFRTVRTKLFVAMGSAIAAFVLLSLLVVARVADDFGEEEIGRNMQFARDAFDGYLDTRRQLLQDKGRALADTPYLKATLSIEDVDHETAFYMASELARVGQSDVLLLADADGRLLADAASDERFGDSLTSQPLTSQALEGTEGCAVWCWQGDVLLVTVTPVTTADALLGVLVLGRKVDAGFADHLRKATGRDVLLFHRDECLAWSYRPTSSGQMVVMNRERAESVLSTLLSVRRGADSVERLTDDGETRLYSTLRAGDLQIVLSRSLDDFDTLSVRASSWLLMLGVILLLAATVVSFLIARRVSQPIARLVTASEQMADGQLETRVEVSGEDELATLSTSFNAMASRIGTLVSDVRAAAEVARSASQAKSNFLANISHELRTPLNGIIGFTSLLLERSESEGDPEQQDWLQTIDRSSHQLLSVVEAVLDVSKIEEGRLDFSLAPCCPRDIVEAVCSKQLSAAEQKGLKLHVEIAAGFPDEVVSDDARLRQMLRCLIENAIKFTVSGHVRVKAGSYRDGSMVRLKFIIADTGIGISADRMDAIFEPFVQADGSTTREYGGVGLGLTISRQIADALGGSLVVSSEVGRGTTVVCEIDAGTHREIEDAGGLSPNAGSTGLRIGQRSRPGNGNATDPGRPLERSVPEDDRSKSQLTGGMLTSRILVVDDASPNRRLVSLVLRKAGAMVEEAVHGQEAIDKFEVCPFDLIFMDMQMPVMDGYTATRELRSRGVTVPIIALTAHAMAGDREKCEAAGCSHYLAKPVTPADLINAVLTALPSGGEVLSDSAERANG